MNTNATLGFHSGHVNGRADPAVTRTFVSWLVQNGLSHSWVQINKKMFDTINHTSWTAYDLARSKSGVFRSSEITMTPDEIGAFVKKSASR